ncbi:hypothetical protein TrVE_jg10640 [Triparma verrucosa]|uniref:Ubiquitin-like domain-containing protein n=1 Tax=Triparma verrucosa TaxID=1606542 RepID=A0A9W7CEH9_9STRA|nr:hypothetical protein TrVE_jg10640 [Triparma verrucosa]
MQIFARNLTGRTLTLSCDKLTRIESIKDQIYTADNEDGNGISPPQQRIIYGGRQLCDSRTIEDYNIQQFSTLHVTGSLSGGELVYKFIVVVFSIAFGVPILKYVYRQYVSKLIESATESIANAQKRATERVSGAGRRVTNNRLSGRFK